MSERLRKLFGGEEGTIPEGPELPLLTIPHDDTCCKLTELAEKALEIAQEEVEARKRAEQDAAYWRDRALKAEDMIRRIRAEEEPCP